MEIKYKEVVLLPPIMIQWLLKSILLVMGWIYVVIDNFVKYPTDELCGIKIDEDLQKLDRKQLCTLLELKFDLGEDVFWNLPSTSKIRLGCQLALSPKKKQ